MSKKIFSVILVVGIVLSLFAGCSSGAPSTEPTDAHNSTAASETETPATVPDETNNAETSPLETTPLTSDSSNGENIIEEEYTTETPQRKAVNMLNYITVLTEGINASSGSRVYLDSAKNSLKNNLSLILADYLADDPIDSKVCAKA